MSESTRWQKKQQIKKDSNEMKNKIKIPQIFFTLNQSKCVI
jgi:hypothetical protein